MAAPTMIFGIDEAVDHLPGRKTPDNGGKPVGDLLERALREASEDSTHSKSALEETEPRVREDGPPLGSKQNPIEIIRRGDTFHSTQPLSKGQLEQIAQVLRSMTGPRDGDLASTKVVYRVVHPSEVRIPGRCRSQAKRPADKELDDGVEDSEVPLSLEERAERKKHRPRTRSGRISKPPHYMVKDYKRIHTLDFDAEPCADSDGGYSDFHFSGEEDSGGDDARMVPLPPGVTTSRARRNRCQYCDKAYIGIGGLARHFRLHPTHRSMVESSNDVHKNGAECDTPSTQNSSMVTEDLTSEATLKDLSEDVQMSTEMVEKTVDVAEGENYPKSKLQEILKLYDDDELREAALPRLAKSVTTVDFLKTRCRWMNPTKPKVLHLYEELEVLLQFVRTQIEASVQGKVDDSSGTRLEVRNEWLAKAIGLEVGSYCVKKTFCVRDNPLATGKPHTSMVPTRTSLDSAVTDAKLEQGPKLSSETDLGVEEDRLVAHMDHRGVCGTSMDQLSTSANKSRENGSTEDSESARSMDDVDADEMPFTMIHRIKFSENDPVECASSGTMEPLPASNEMLPLDVSSGTEDTLHRLMDEEEGFGILGMFDNAATVAKVSFPL